MKNTGFIVFAFTALALYSLISYYIFHHFVSFALASGISHNLFLSVFLIISSSFIIGRVLERQHLFRISFPFTIIGSYWFACILYFVLAILFFDIFSLFSNYFEKNRYYFFFYLLIITAILLIAGTINAYNSKISSINLKINKKSSLQSLKIVALSDVHIGSIIGKNRLIGMIKKINHLKPDIVLFAGDLLDEIVFPHMKNDYSKLFQNIQSKYGMFAITGNHEYIGGIDNAKDFYLHAGIHLLVDENICIDDKFILIGRKDNDSKRFGSETRKSNEELLQNIDFQKPVIVLDHQPYGLKKLSNYPVDLQISGHTHHGQMFPLNFVTSAIFEISRGLKKINNTWFYVSTGYGTWGPPVRIGNRPEIVNICLQFNS